MEHTLDGYHHTMFGMVCQQAVSSVSVSPKSKRLEIPSLAR